MGRVSVLSVATALLLGSALHAGEAEFLALCKSSKLSQSTALTVHSLRRFAAGGPAIDTPTCEVTFKTLQKTKELELPGGGYTGINISDLAPIATLDWIESLYLRGQENVTDLSPLKKMKLKSLRIEDTKITDLTPLLEMPKLEELGVSLVTEDAQKVIAKIPTLTRVLVTSRLPGRLDLGELAKNPSIRELEINPFRNAQSTVYGLAGFSSLESLTMFGSTIEADDIDSLPLKKLLISFGTVNRMELIGEMDSLEDLSLHRLGIRSITFVGKLTKLKSLGLAENRIDDIWPLTSLKDLESISLLQNQVLNADALSQLTNRRSISLSGNKISGAFALNNLTKIERLYLDGNEFYALSLLPGVIYPNLKVLDLARNVARSSSAENINGKNFPGLEEINISNNDISYVDSFGTLTNLKSFTADSNKISDISPLKNLTKLEHLSVRENYLRSPACPIKQPGACDFMHQRN